MEKKRFTTESRWLIDGSIAVLFAVCFGYDGIHDSDYLSLVIAIVDLVWLANSIRNYFKARHGIAIEVDEEGLLFSGCCTLRTEKGEQNIGDKKLRWDEIAEVFFSSSTVLTKGGLTYGVNDPLGWLDRTKVWKTIEEYLEVSRKRTGSL